MAPWPTYKGRYILKLIENIKMKDSFFLLKLLPFIPFKYQNTKDDQIKIFILYRLRNK